jgi:hypothetical protein
LTRLVEKEQPDEWIGSEMGSEQKLELLLR